MSESAVQRAVFFQRNGIKLFDSLHLALAEVNRVGVFLTTDDGLLRAADRIKTDVTVANIESLHDIF
jgi:predicted nucleic acid-binding protein